MSLLASPLASADSDVTTPVVTTLGPYTIDGYDETFSYTTSPLAFDNYVTGTYDGTGFDLDTYFGPTGSDSYEVVLTDPGVLQLGVDHVDGSVSYIHRQLLGRRLHPNRPPVWTPSQVCDFLSEGNCAPRPPLGTACSMWRI